MIHKYFFFSPLLESKRNQCVVHDRHTEYFRGSARECAQIASDLEAYSQGLISVQDMSLISIACLHRPNLQVVVLSNYDTKQVTRSFINHRHSQEFNKE